MGSSSSKKKTPAPPKIEEPIPVVTESESAIAAEGYMKAKEDEKMSVASTLMTSTLEPRETMLASNTKKKKSKAEMANSATTGLMY
jgi:hypothetical protein